MTRGFFCSACTAHTQSVRIFDDRRVDYSESESADIMYYHRRSCCPDRYHHPENAELYHRKAYYTRRSIERRSYIRSYSEQDEQLFQKGRENRKTVIETGEASGKKSGRIITFFFAIFCFLPILPDIIGTRILYKKIKFPYFIVAVIIGKSVTHIPFIFLGKWIAQILHLRI